MPRIKADNTLKGLFDSLDEQTIVMDDSGEVLGYIMPACAISSTLYLQALAEVDLEELARRSDDTRPGKTTAEVLANLREREESECGSP